MFCTAIPDDKWKSRIFHMIDTTGSNMSASYLDILLNIDSNSRLTTTLHDKRDDFDFAIVNFLYTTLWYTTFTWLWCVYLQVNLIHKSMLCVREFCKTKSNTDKKKSKKKSFNESRLTSSFCKDYYLYNDLVCDYNYHRIICWMTCFILFVRQRKVSIVFMTTVYPVYVISTN
jgi:hypothetical protein